METIEFSESTKISTFLSESLFRFSSMARESMSTRSMKRIFKLSSVGCIPQKTAMSAGLLPFVAYGQIYTFPEIFIMGEDITT
jgi:hypothetical protein